MKTLILTLALLATGCASTEEFCGSTPDGDEYCVTMKSTNR